MGLKIARYFSLFFVGLVLGPSLAHLLELPNKRLACRARII